MKGPELVEWFKEWSAWLARIRPRVQKTNKQQKET
jgi:hypothetical protein